MNKWQMDGGSLRWADRGGYATDNKGKTHSSIHPAGRSEKHRMAQRRKHSRVGVPAKTEAR